MKKGKVYLVGAGCGDPGLLTVKAGELLGICDTVIYDSLISEELLGRVRPDCEKIYVGKRYGAHAMKQQEINRLLAEKAGEGKLVVRLKGGDPYLFGRGGEEFLALKEAGIFCLEIPGISSAIAVPAAAGIPVTHRGLSGSVTVVTGTAAGEDGRPSLQLDFETLARLSGTLVILMGMHFLKEISLGLMRAGKHPDTPCAVIMEGTTERQRCLRTSLVEMPREASAQGYTSPSVIVVGDVAELELLWKPESETLYGTDVPSESETKLIFDTPSVSGTPAAPALMDEALPELEAPCGHDMPLAGVTVGATGTPGFVGRLSLVLRQKGARVWDMGFLEARPTGTPLPDFEDCSWLVFTSPNGAGIFLEQMKRLRRDLRSLGNKKIAVVGPGTARVFEEAGLFADYMPEIYDVRHLAEGLSERMEKTRRNREMRAVFPGSPDREKAVFLRAQGGSDELPAVFGRKGIPFAEVPLYELCVCQEKRAAALGRKPDYLVFGSARGVRTYFEGAAGLRAGGIGSRIGAAEVSAIEIDETDATDLGIGETGECPRCVCIGEMCGRELEKYIGRGFLTAGEASVEGIAACLCADAALRRGEHSSESARRN